MAPKSNPQPLRLDQVGNIDQEDVVDARSPRSPLSSKSPRSPRIPFGFPSSKRTKSQGANLTLDIADLEATTPTEASSQPAGLLPAQEAAQPLSVHQEKTESDRPTRTGFFSNYKASRSASRLQTEQDLAQDTDEPQLSSSLPSQESKRNGMIMVAFVSYMPCALT